MSLFKAWNGDIYKNRRKLSKKRQNFLKTYFLSSLTMKEQPTVKRVHELKELEILQNLHWVEIAKATLGSRSLL